MSSSYSSKQQRLIIQQNHLQAWAKSGLLQLAYSELHGIKYQAFYKWIQRSRKKVNCQPINPLSLLNQAISSLTQMPYKHWF